MNFDNSIAGLAMVLARDMNMTITITGEDSYCATDGSRINIARMPDTPEGRMLVTGLCMHEVGHKKYTTGNLATGMMGHMTNIVEDIRTEILTIADRPGTRFNLNAVTEYYARGALNPESLADAICCKVMSYGRGVVLQQPGITQLIPVCDEVMDDAFGQQFIDDLDKIIVGLPKLKDTDDAKKMAKKICDLITQQATPPQPPTPAPGPGIPGAGGIPGQSQGLGSGAPGNSTAPGTPDPNAKDLSPSSKKLKNKGGKGGFNDGSGAQKPVDVLVSEILGDDSTYGDLSKMIQKDLNIIAQQHKGDKEEIPMLPYVSNIRKNGLPLNEVEAISASSKMRSRLMGQLQSIQRKPLSYGQSGKKLASGRLERISIGDPRIFKKKIEVHAINTAIVICGDYSGSMSSSTHLTNPAMFAIHNALYGLKGVAVCSLEYAGRACSAAGKQQVNIMTDFKEKPLSKHFDVNTSGGTPTHECLWAARAMLMHRTEPRKIILVVTDGEPDSPKSTHAASKKAIACGIEVTAIGIKADCVKQFWKGAEVIHTVPELPKAMFSIFEKLLANKKMGTAHHASHR